MEGLVKDDRLSRAREHMYDLSSGKKVSDGGCKTDIVCMSVHVCTWDHACL